MRSCSRCGREVTGSVYGSYCSSACKVHRVTKVCESCGNEFQGTHNQRFHSQTCWITWYNTHDRDHAVQGGEAGAVANQNKWSKYEGPRRAYIKSNGRHQHRVEAEQMLGRELEPGEVVHHKNENRFDNSWFNLWVFPSQRAHARDHSDHRRLQIAA